MKETNPSSIKKLFDKYAEGFDSIYGDRRNIIQRWTDRYFRKSMRVRFERSVEKCIPIEGTRILDVGCGPGRYAVHLASLGAKEVVGVDVSPRMIELAREYAKQKGVEDRCTFVEGDVMDYAPEETFDVSIVMGVMDYISDPIPFLERILSLTTKTVCLSFPDDIGVLAWQRRLRYRWFSHCELNLYSLNRLEKTLDKVVKRSYTVEHIARDFFVSIDLEE